MKLEDKRIKKHLKQIPLDQYTVYHSPIKSWFLFIFLILIIISPFSIYFIGSLFSTSFNIIIISLIISYFIISYVISAYYNNSFIVSNNYLLVINPNFPFKTIKKYNLSSINEVIIDNDKRTVNSIFLWIFFIINRNQIKIKLGKKIETFYCVNLDVDCCGENWTEKNLDDFYNDLKSKNINVHMKI